MIFTTGGALTIAVLEQAPSGLAITARIVDGDETLDIDVTVAPSLDGEGDPLDAYTGTFTAPLSLPVAIEWLLGSSVVASEIVALTGTSPAPDGHPGYPTREELVAASNVAELTGLSTAQQDALRDMAIDAVERFTGQRFEPYVDDLVIDGGGGREVFPTKRVESLTAIVVQGTSIDLTDVVVSEAGDRIHFAPYSTDYAVMAMRETAFDSRTFRSGSGTVVLSGLFGWSVTPAAVTQAIRLEMEAQAQADASALSGIVASARRLGLRDLSQGNLRASLGDPSEVTPMSARLLARYVWTGAGGFLV